MSTGTLTRSATQSSSYTKIVYVTGKVQADFLAILDTYGYFSDDHAVALIKDVRTLLDEDVIATVNFAWTERGTSRVIEEIRYLVITGGLGLVDDRPGGIRYNPALAIADFNVHVTCNARWMSWSEDDRQSVLRALTLPWGPAGALSYSNGRWRSDRTYSSGGYGLSRQWFTR